MAMISTLPRHRLGAVVGALVLIAAASGWILARAPERRDLALVGFSQSDRHTLELRFSYQPDRAGFVRLSEIPKEVGLHDISERPLDAAGVSGDQVRIDLDERDAWGEYSLLVLPLSEECWPRSQLLVREILRRCPQAGYIEIVRQPANWLRAMFGFERLGGYSILGRRSMPIETSPMEEMGDIVLQGSLALPAEAHSDRAPLTIYPEVNEAARLVRHLWSRELRTGPISSPYDSFLSKDLGTKLDMLQTGQFAVMCQGMRDLFLHATLSIPGLKARAVEAFNYAKPFEDLVTYGHSTSEIWVKELKQWVIVDPWIGAAFRDEMGRFLSAEDLASDRISSNNIEVVPLLKAVSRFATGADGQIIRFILDPSRTQLDRYTDWPLGHSPGYRIYFKVLRYRSVVLAQLPRLSS
jgi:hypothetical protein